MEQPDRQLVSLRIPKELNKKLTHIVTDMGISKASFILMLIDKAVSKKIAEKLALQSAMQPVMQPTMQPVSNAVTYPWL